MQAHLCEVCGFLYDDESAELTPEGIRIPFEDLPEAWSCPTCGVNPTFFTPIDSDRMPDIPDHSSSS